MSDKYHKDFGSITHPGLIKEFNSDAILDFSILDGHVFMVCDGHDGTNGHAALAAKLTTDSIKKYFYNRSYKEMGHALPNAVTYANFVVYEQSVKEEKYNGIGSTLAILIYRDNKVHYAYAGDSRIYLFNNQKLQPLTRDHVSDSTDLRNAEVTVLIGKQKDIRFGVSKNPLTVSENDLFLLCTDGLTDALSDDEISEVLSDPNMSPEHKCMLLNQKVIDKGGDDNVSVQIIEFVNSEVVQQAEKKKMKRDIKRILLFFALLIAVAILSFAGYKGYRLVTSQTIQKPKEQQETKSKGSIEVKQNISSEKANTAVKKTVPEKAQQAAKKEPVEQVIEDNLKQHVMYYEHEVKFGENLYRLGLRYHVTQQKLIEVNGNHAKNLVAGYKLKIPVKDVYKVKKGDTYSSVCQKYQVKQVDILKANKLEANSPLIEGHKLIIPQ